VSRRWTGRGKSSSPSKIRQRRRAARYAGRRMAASIALPAAQNRGGHDMSGYLGFFLFQIFPYIAIFVFLLGCLLRYDRDPYSWRTKSSQLLRRRQLIVGSILFHVGILLILAGHAVGLLTPIWIFDALGVSHGAKQILAIVLGGVAGISCLIGISMLLHRRLFDARIRNNSSFADIAVLVLLLAQLLLGLFSIPV